MKHKIVGAYKCTGGTAPMEERSKELKKIIYTDSERDLAISGEIIREDDFFFTIISRGRTYKIGKKSIVCIKEVGGSQ